MSDHVDPAEDLTPRELDILRLLAENCSNREIAEKLVLSLGTVKWYNRQIYNKLVVNSRQEAVEAAKLKGILERAPEVKRPHNLPAPITPFVGREHEQSELIALLEKPDIRLITVLGSGGIGKTRLALEASRRLVRSSQANIFNDGVFFVDLAPVNNPDNIFAAIADAIAFRFHSGERSPEQQLLAYLKNKSLLLILDNFEHLLDGAATVIKVLRAAPDIALLITSRARLNISGETIFKLTGMDYPDKQNAQKALEYSAVQLFLQSARRAKHDFAIETGDLPHILRICRLVQGMPLGIILAAAWVEILSLAEIDQEITRSIDFLATEQRDLPKRLRSIRAVFDHSWNLMSKTETEVFMRLCVFRGGFTRQATESVANADLHILISLTNKSLIQRNVDKDRYNIHELLRQYAAQQLQSSGQWGSVQQQHAEFYVQLAERAQPELRLSDQEHWFNALETEHDNLRAAMAWSFGSGEIMSGVRIVVALRDFWFYQGYHVEGHHWYELALAHVTDEKSVLYGRILLGLGLLNWARQQVDECRQNWDEALSVFREAGDRHHFAWALGLGADPTDYHTAVERIQRAINILREIDDPGVAQMLNILGNVHRNPPDYQKAKAAYKDCLEVVRQTGEKRREVIILQNLGLVAYAEGNYEEAGSLAREAAGIARRIGFKNIYSSCLHALAGSLAATDRAPEAARLVGAVDAYHQDQGIRFPPNDQPYHDRIQADVRQQLDAVVFKKSWEAGHRMSIESALEFALRL